MLFGNKRYKQILIDNDNYNSLKKLGQTGDSFNSVIGKLIKNFKEGDKINCQN
jgi:predicted CopG family antitoxin